MANTLNSASTESNPSQPAPPICAIFAALVALIVLAGWSTHAYALVTILPTLPAMAQRTAGAFLLASTSLGRIGPSH